MVRAAGIDPGTKSMDVCAIEDGEIFYEKPIDNIELAKDPEIIVKAMRESLPLDLIAGPSGYGIELTHINEIPEEVFEDWYYNHILLTTKEEILKGMEEGVFGAILYKNMADFSLKLKKDKLPVIFIPSVIILPTVPRYRKTNKLDMGTADKMAVAVLATYDQARELGIPYSEVSFILVEIGFGYNAVIGVEGGRIVDGIGGTTFPSIGFLTASALDFELAQIVHNWEKQDVFTGGVASIAEITDPEEFVRVSDDKSKIAWDAMMEGIERAVASMKVCVEKPKEILISGRLAKVKGIRDELVKRLSNHAELRNLGYLEGAKLTKETAQGYAVVAEGLAGGKFERLVEWMKIKEGKGTTLDYIYHPKFKGVKDKFVRFK